MSEALALELAGEPVTLSAGKSLYWPGGGALFVADPHWGKASSFRAAGVAVPTASLAHDLARLSRDLDRSGATRLVFLGDLFHDRDSKSALVFDAVAAWREARPSLEILLVRGNHDRRAGDPPAEWDFAVESEPVEFGPFALRHYPEPTPGRYTLCGHVHPGVALAGPGRQRLRLPCFHFTPTVGTLPAFGGFTGTADVRPARGDRVVVVADGELVRVA